MAFANGLLMSVPRFLWTECNNRVSQQNQPNTKKLKQQALMKDETYDVKKANSFEKFLEMKKGKKKEHLRQQIVLHFRSEDISFVEKHYLPQNT